MVNSGRFLILNRWCFLHLDHQFRPFLPFSSWTTPSHSSRFSSRVTSSKKPSQNLRLNQMSLLCFPHHQIIHSCLCDLLHSILGYETFNTKTVFYSSLYTQHVTEWKLYSRYLMKEWINTFWHRPSGFVLLITRVYLLKLRYQLLGCSTEHVHPHNRTHGLTEI